MSRLETKPLISVETLWNWDASKVDERLVGKPLENYPHKWEGPKTLICHDMMGGYLPQENATGCEVDCFLRPFIVPHWWYIDIFTYFSHNFITIPPVGWINQAHSHGVLVLGTFITEWERGAVICNKLFEDEETVSRTVMQMVSIAVVYNFDGWLINIENEIEGKYIPLLDLFVSSLTTEMRCAIGERSRVIWYDAVTVCGDLKWQNELNALNERWFDITNGIFLNYPWKPEQLKRSREVAKNRNHEVYVGVDCYGRGSYAFAHARELKLSVALFAPGWIAETLPAENIVPNSIKFWDRLAALVKPHRITTAPIVTNFSIGFSADSKRYNLCDAQMQPFYLESNAFPQISAPSLVIPDAGNYKLFLTDMTLSGFYMIKATASAPMALLLWSNDDNLYGASALNCVKCNSEGTWVINFVPSRIKAIGFRTERLTVVEFFSLLSLDAEDSATVFQDSHNYPFKDDVEEKKEN